MSLTATLGSAADSIGGMILLMPTFVSSLDATTGHMQPGQTVGAKSIVLDYGVSGNGFYEVSAIDGIYGENSPYAQIATWTGHPGTGQTLRSRWGNLKGVFGVANEYGMYIGNGTAATSQFLRLSSYTNEIHNLPITMYDGSGNLFMRADTSGLEFTGVDQSYARIRWLTSGDAAEIGTHLHGDNYKRMDLRSWSAASSAVRVGAWNSGQTNSPVAYVDVSQATYASKISLIADVVGVGITTPGFKLDVADRIRIRAGNNGSAGIWLTDSSASSNTVFIGQLGTNVGDDFGVWNNGGWRLRVSSTTTTVTSNLAVDGNLGAWSTPSYGSNWTDYGGAYGGARYRKFGDTVTLQGLVISTATPSATVATLPAGYTPAHNRVFTVYSSNGAIRLDVNSTGTITTPGTTFSGGSQWVSLNGVSFSTTN